MQDYIFRITCFLWIIHITSAYECYVCTRQEDNYGKCIQTVKTCQPEEDRCLSKVRWGSTPYWDATGEKQYYISKQCATKKVCDDAIRNVSALCDRIWYNDWECAECCTGDRCNFYITLGGSSLLPNLRNIFSLIFAMLCLRLYA